MGFTCFDTNIFILLFSYVVFGAGFVVRNVSSVIYWKGITWVLLNNWG